MATEPRELIGTHWGHALSLGFGVGLSPWAPGTLGTLLGFPLFMAIRWLSLGWQWTILAALFVLGVWTCGKTARELGVDDPGSVVWDEVVAFAWVLTATPLTPQGWLTGFVLFRLFDIWKPFPIGWLDRRLKGGFGIMIDDALAAAITIWLIWHLSGLRWFGLAPVGRG